MKKPIIKILSLIIVAVSLLAPVGARAQLMDNGKYMPDLVNYIGAFNWPGSPDVAAEGAYLIDCDTGAVLYRKQSNEHFYPASITKVLTALVVCEKVSDLNEMLTFSHNAIYNLEEGGYSYVAKEGDTLSVYDTLHAMLMNSSNESAVALAEHVAGSVEEFAKLMNEKARELGASDSNFVNPNGLSNTEHVTTPHDMALILRAAVNNHKFLEIATKRSYTTGPTSSHPEGYGCIMSHKMMQQTDFYDERVVCGKTGYLSMAQNTLVTYASSGGMNLVCVVMRDNGATQAYIDTKALLDYGFNNFEHKAVSNVVNYDDMEAKLESLSSQSILDVDYEDSFFLTIPKGADVGNITWDVEYTDKADTGKIKYYAGGMEFESREFSVSYNATVFDDIAAAVSSEDGNPSPLAIILIVIGGIAVLGVGAIIILRVRNAKRIRKRRRGESRRAANHFERDEF